MSDPMPEHHRETAERHLPVMADRAVELLGPAIEPPGSVLVDGTLGLAGHAERFLMEFPELVLVGLDRDTNALRLAGERLRPFRDRIHLVHTRFDGIDDALRESGIAGSAVSAVLLDLGVSSMQLDEQDRGFSYSTDAPLDMRMDTTSELTAADVVNTYSAADIARVLSMYGEERFARRIAAEIVKQRAQEPFTTSGPLVELLYRAIPAATRRTGGHPAKRTFQALRIEVNGELDSLREVLGPALDSLRIGGRIAIMSYHSLEDRMVKRALADRCASRTPPGLPVELPGAGPEFRLLTRGAERADEAEAASNPRAVPVRLRAAERIARRDA
ncbi:16S rRNA (cytosine(1402)-N(4))-methyltransferase RsmH [Lolliginicoccus suaedae]|uniref:16S rRNA (cytosine(1402)-N(4))-methyltransferase RsmH n=1 Tax=Lolliginicoccus suaedae TaxID=2605429 RepID=UPI0011EF744B|nr:16S rRNA (cytosine(1402)-N(4))-methyltransferase RsmH [Lolliginicoccus suaedae]